MPSRLRTAFDIFGDRSARKSVVFLAVLLAGRAITPVRAQAQSQSPNALHLSSPVLAITYDIERAKTAQSTSGGFWLQGGSMDVAFPFYRGFSAAGRVGGDRASNIGTGANLDKITYLAGPRYTIQPQSHLQIFGEGLFGAVHAFDSIFPVNGGLTSTANSFAMQFGGGVDLALHNGLALRALEVDYVRTTLPNNATNSQNDLRLAFGLSYHFNRK